LLYRLTQQFPREEIYGLSSQLRPRECFRREQHRGGMRSGNNREYRCFVGMARGSALEIQTQLVIARELSLGDAKQLDHAEALAEEISKMLWAIRQRLGSAFHRSLTTFHCLLDPFVAVAGLG
jgi:four helix bundle protein